MLLLRALLTVFHCHLMNDAGSHFIGSQWVLGQWQPWVRDCCAIDHEMHPSSGGSRPGVTLTARYQHSTLLYVLPFQQAGQGIKQCWWKRRACLSREGNGTMKNEGKTKWREVDMGESQEYGGRHRHWGERWIMRCTWEKKEDMWTQPEGTHSKRAWQ